MLESEVEAYFVWCVARFGGKSYKFTSPSWRGVSDQIACMPNGETWFIELKRPKGGVASPHQIQFREDMEKLNQHYACLNTKEKIDLWKTSF